MRKVQTATKLENRKNILKVLIDNQWHSYKEIREKANISNVTLSEHFKELKPLLDKKRDPSTNRLSRLYKIKPVFALVLASEFTVGIAWKEMEEKFLKGKDFESADWKSVLENINIITNKLLLSMTYTFANEDLRKDSELLYLLLETFVWENYKTLTLKFMEAFESKLPQEP